MKNYAYIILSVCIIGIAMFRLTDKEGAKRVLEANNYKSIEVYKINYPVAAFSGGRDDFYVTGFKAISPNGTPVTGVVTRGFWKGSTIRLN